MTEPMPKIDPTLMLGLALGECARTIVDLLDVRDNAIKSIADIQERMESIQLEIKRINSIMPRMEMP
jgi:hypothetical protein